MFGDTPCTNVQVALAQRPYVHSAAWRRRRPGHGDYRAGNQRHQSLRLIHYEPPPTVSGIVPPNGLIAGGYGVTINGTGFTNVVAVYFGAKPAINFIALSSADIAATVPPGVSMSGGVIDVTVVTADGTSAITGADQFNYLSPVTVTAISPVTGPPAGGTQVIITGTDFTGASAVNFGGNPATFTVNSATQITATSPAGGGTVDITVTTPPYSSEPTSADLFSYSSAVAGGAFATLPTTAVGSTSAPQNVQVTLQSASAISGITVPMSQNGVAEFTIGTVTGCSLGGSVNPSGTVCTVPVSFSPQYPGLRTGMLTINNAGDVVGTAGLTGIGLGPEVAISPGALNMSIGGGVYGVTATPQSVTTAALSVSNNFSALAIDWSGNMYIADNINCLAYKVNFLTNQIVTIAGNYTFAAGAVLPSTTPIPALGSATCPIAIAVDGAGNVFVADANIAVNDAGTYDSPYPGVVEEISAATGEIVIVAGNPNSSLTATTTPQSALSVAIQAVNSLTTDAAGNLYISDFFNNLVEKVTPDGNIVVVAGSGGPGGGGPGGPFTTPQPATSVYLNGPTGMVVDASGNLYISDQNINLIEQVNAAGNIITVAGGGGSTPSTTPQPAPSVAFNAPGELAVDGAGNLYIADILNSEVEQLNLAGQLAVVAGGGAIVPTSAVQSSLTASLGLIEGVEVDGAGNIYIADGQNIGNGDNMIEKVSTLAAPLNFPYTNEGTNSAPQWLTLANIGNQSLTLSSLSSPPDYPLQSTGTCTVTANNPQTLTTGSSCSVAYLLDPINAGILNETATLIDNNLNASISQQVISFTGAAIGGTVDTPTFSPAAGTYLTSQSVTISDATVGATVYYTTDGSAPTTNSMIYSSPIPVPASMLIQALSADNGANSSTVASAAYTINNPAPVVSNLSPAIASAGGAAFTLTVNGSGYIPSSTVYWGSSALATTYVSATELTAQVTAANVASAGITAVTVQSPAPGGGTSNAFQFEVDSAASGTAQITTGTYTVAPGSTAGYAAVPPSGTTIVSVQCLNLPAGATCSYQSALGLLNIATSATTPAGTYQITAVFTLTEPGAASGFIFLPILLLPLVLLRRKLAARGVWANAFLGLILLVGAAVACTGCGGGGSLTQTHQVTSSGTVTLTIT